MCVSVYIYTPYNLYESLLIFMSLKDKTSSYDSMGGCRMPFTHKHTHTQKLYKTDKNIIKGSENF